MFVSRTVRRAAIEGWIRTRISRECPKTFRAMSGGVNETSESKDKLVIFDTTLRDGEQSPGATLNRSEKLQIASALSMMGVDVCEAGFPIASPGDFDAVRQIAEEIGPLTEGRLDGSTMRIAGLSRASEKDIVRCYDAVKVAPKHRIHTFLATSDIHLKYKLKMSHDECIQKCASAVALASSLVDDVEFSCEDAGRSDPDFMCDVLGEVIKAGATTLNIPDTVGYVAPDEYGALIKYLIENTPGGKNPDVIWSVHCHNDLGLAVANSLAAISNGARQAECTVNGIGERAGNASLEEIVMAIRTRPNLFPVHTKQIDTTRIIRTSRMVSQFTGLSVQRNKAIVGVNAFSHEAGIHQDGVLKHQQTYEIMRPESVGLTSNMLVLGKHSGKHAYRSRLLELGFSDLTDEQIEDFVDRFKRLADEKKVVTDADMETIVSDELYKPEPVWALKSVHVTAGNLLKPTATVSMVDKDGKEVNVAEIGAGPVDSIFKCIKRIIETPTTLIEYQVSSVTQGTGAVGSVSVTIQRTPEMEDTKEGTKMSKLNPQTGDVSQKLYTGSGSDTDILVASAKAYVNAFNKLVQSQEMDVIRSRRVAEAAASASGN